MSFIFVWSSQFPYDCFSVLSVNGILPNSPLGRGGDYSTQVYIHVGRHHPEVQPLTFLDAILTEMLPLLYNFNLTKVPHSHTFITGPYYEQIKKKALLSFSCNVGKVCIWYLFMLLDGERHCEGKVSCPLEYNALSLVRARTWTAWCRDERTSY